jgi:hypothetical protein
MQRAFLD